MHEINAEEAQQVNEGGEEGDNGDDLGESNDVERGRVSNLLAPPGEQEVDYREEEREEDGVGDVQRQWQGVGGLWAVAIVDHLDSHGRSRPDSLAGFSRRRSPANVHFDPRMSDDGHAGGESDSGEKRL